MVDAVLVDAVLVNAVLVDTDLVDAGLAAAVLAAAVLAGAVLAGAVLAGAVFADATLADPALADGAFVAAAFIGLALPDPAPPALPADPLRTVELAPRPDATFAGALAAPDFADAPAAAREVVTAVDLPVPDLLVALPAAGFRVVAMRVSHR